MQFTHEFDCRILFLEEGVEDDITKGDSLFSAIDDSVYKKAMSLYTKQKDDAKLVEEAFKGAVFDESKVQKPIMDPVNGDIIHDKPETSDESISSSNKIDMEVDLSAEKNDKESAEPGDTTRDKPETSDESISSSNKIDMEVDPSEKNDKESAEPGDTTRDKTKTSDESISSSNKMDMEVDQPVQKNDKESCEPSGGGGKYKVKVKAKDSCNDYDGSKELDIPSSLLVLTNVSSNELIELGSVDRSRIHQHSPESTH